MKIHRQMTNLEIRALLKAVASAYQLKSAKKNRFRIIAYQRAADAVEHLSSEAKDLWDEGKLEEVAGIGKSIAAHIDEIFRTGKSKHFEKVLKNLPPAMFELIKVSGIGTKSAFKLTKELGISSTSDALNKLRKAAKAGKIAKIQGFGKSSQEAILKSLSEIKGKKRRLLLPYATRIAGEVIDWLNKSSYVKRADSLGSLRRRTSTVGDVDISAATDNPVEVIDHFCRYPKKTRVLEKGKRTASIIIPGDRQVDLMVEHPAAYGALLQHFTGSKHHNIAIRKHAQKLGLSISDYGVRRKGSLQKVRTEKVLYKKLGMEWIPPELREDRGEIEAALTNKIPVLVEDKDIKADLQIHSNFEIETSHDLGESSMKEIITKANELGYEYVAFTEHNPSKGMHTQKQIEKLLKSKKSVIEELNYSLVKKMKGSIQKVFNSLEIDILPDGNLPVNESALELLDFALVSIHSSFGQDRRKMTQRVLSALNHPKVKIFAHPTARKLNEREGIELDWDRIFQFCLEKDKWVEINASPSRLDLPDTLVRDAVRLGVKLTLGTDSHHADYMVNMKYGVSVARRGWATKEDIVNTRPLREFERMLE